VATQDDLLRQLGVKPRKRKKKAKRRRRRRKVVIGVVDCSADKLSPADHGRRTLPARVLYSKSSTFNLKRAYVEAVADHWIILSAKHGVVLPDQELATYDKVLPRKGDPAWAARVRKQLRSMFDNDTSFLVVTSKPYQAHLFTPDSGFDYDAPLQKIKVPKGKRLGIGYQRGWLKTQLEGLT
jgi:hypothetical protein